MKVICELEDKGREVFQGEYEKDLVLNCITAVTVYRIPVTKLSKVHIIFTKP